MRFRAGLAVGFATGFYVGAMAGRERYQQINRTVRRIKRSPGFDAAADKAKAVVDLGVERAKDMVETRFGRESGNGRLAADIRPGIGPDIGPVQAGPTRAGQVRADPVQPDPLARTPGRSGLTAETVQTGNGDSPS